MKWIDFLFFSIMTLCYIWNGEDEFSKKEWFFWGLKFIGVIIGTLVFGITLKGIGSVWSGLTNETAGFIMMAVGLSFTTILGMKFLVVMLCEIFWRIMTFHKKYNANNFKQLSTVSKKVAPSLLIFSKFLISCGSMLMFYGIWLT